MKKAIVIGASSGIGEAVARVLANNGYEVGLTARRFELLEKLQKEIPSRTYIRRMDVTRREETAATLEDLIKEMSGLDLIVLNAGINVSTPDLKHEKELETVDVNVSGFVLCADIALKYFTAQKSGHIVGISSIAGLRGSATCPAYSASKAFVSNYMEGLRHRVRSTDIYVTDIRPGFVDTEMIKGFRHLFWVAQPLGAAEQIFSAIKNKKKMAYITRRWNIMAWLLRWMPDWMYAQRYRERI
ncbi:MAG: SDR family NAD(P)-dependent oxidoreductase [Candidatus Omnitrophota bacterium]|nr:MAG: SDR family NAD(P)-dependent oxidoreductase [Candidatus Omnitrophota bacterium]